MDGLLGRFEAVALAGIAWMEGSAARRALVLAFLAAVTLMPGLATLPPTDRDESRYIQASRQMLETGDFVDIRFQEEPRWKKPVGIYWLQAAAALPFGGADAPVWAWRLPSALAVLAAGLLAAWALTPLVGLRAANLAAIMLVTSAGVVAEGHIAKTDAVLLACTLLAMGALARLRDGPGPGFGWLHLAFWAAIGAGLLVKGPITPMVAGFAVAWVCLAERSAALLRATRPLPGLLVAAAVAAPWLVAIGLRTQGAFFEEAILGDLLSKVAASPERHWGPPGYYLLAVWGTLWPWAALMLFAAPTVWRRRREPAVRFLLGWLVPFWILYELLATKLPHYPLPVFPALLGLVALWIAAPEKGSPGPARLVAAAGLFAVPGLGLALSAAGAVPLLEGELSAAGLALGLLAVGAVAVGARALSDRRVTAFLAAALLAAMLLFPAILAFTLPRLDTLFLSPRLAAAHAPFRACTGRPLVSVGYWEPSLVVAAGTDTRLVRPDAAKELLRGSDGWVILFEERRNQTLATFLAEGGIRLQVLGSVSGFNYNRGRRTTVFLVAREGDPALAPCLAARSGGSG